MLKRIWMKLFRKRFVEWLRNEGNEMLEVRKPLMEQPRVLNAIRLQGFEIFNKKGPVLGHEAILQSMRKNGFEIFDVTRSVLEQPAVARPIEQSGFEISPRDKGYHRVPDIFGKSSHKLRDIRSDELFNGAAKKAVEGGRTLLYYDRLYNLYQALRSAAHVPAPRIAEIGVYRGGGCRFLAELCSTLGLEGAAIVGVDTFEGHDARDVEGGREGEHAPGLFSDTDYDDVRAYLSSFPAVRLVRGRVQDAGAELGDGPYALVHLDADLHAPTAFSLDFFRDRMAPGGIIVVDDYGFVTCPGVRRAVDDFASRSNGDFLGLRFETGQFFFVRR